jgi:replicative DNA helicase
MEINRIPPQNIDAEQSVLCSIMLDNNIYDSVRMIISADDFYRPEHVLVFKAVEETGGDIVSVANHLKDSGKLDRVGGPAYLAEISDKSIPSETLAIQHANIIRDCMKKRTFIAKASDMVNSCYGGLDFSNLAEELEKESFALTEQISTGSEAESIGEIIKRTKKRLETISINGADAGLMTGLSDFDNMTSGLRDSDLIVLAARPSMGKTALAFNLLKRLAGYQIPVGAFSLEMSKDSLGERMLADMTNINSKNIRSGWISDNQWPVIAKATDEFRSMPLYIDDTPSLHISEIRSRARRMKRKHDIKFIAVDYIQFARGDGGNREQEVADISRGLKAMAKELKIPVLALAQLNRGLESRADKRPMLSDLRESGAIEQDADVITFIYRDEYYNKNSNKKGIAELIFGKQRNGPTGVVELMWREGTCSFHNLHRN